MAPNADMSRAAANVHRATEALAEDVAATDCEDWKDRECKERVLKSLSERLGMSQAVSVQPVIIIGRIGGAEREGSDRTINV